MAEYGRVKSILMEDEGACVVVAADESQHVSRIYLWSSVECRALCDLGVATLGRLVKEGALLPSAKFNEDDRTWVHAQPLRRSPS